MHMQICVHVDLRYTVYAHVCVIYIYMYVYVHVCFMSLHNEMFTRNSSHNSTYYMYSVQILIIIFYFTYSQIVMKCYRNYMYRCIYNNNKMTLYCVHTLLQYQINLYSYFSITKTTTSMININCIMFYHVSIIQCRRVIQFSQMNFIQHNPSLTHWLQRETKANTVHIIP